MAHELAQDTNTARAEAELARYLEECRADREYRATVAIADMSFAWKVLEQDTASGEDQFGTKRFSSVAISRNFSLQPFGSKSVLESVAISARRGITGNYDASRAFGPNASDMFIGHYEKGIVLPQYSIPAEEFALPGRQPEAMFFARQVSDLVKFLGMPAKKRAALQRYDRRHP